MKRRHHHKFISSIRSPAGRACTLQLFREAVSQAGGWAASRRPFVSPGRKDLASPTPSPSTTSSVAPGSWAGSSGVVFMWQSKTSSGIPGQLVRIRFHADLKPCLVPDPKGRGHCGLSRVHWPLEPAFQSMRKSRTGLREQVFSPSQVTAPRFLLSTLTVFTNKWVSYTFITTPRHSYSF